MQSTLETSLQQQHDQIQHVLGNAQRTTDHLVAGNKNLDKATRRGVEFRNFMLFFFLLLASILLFLHYYDQ